MEGSMKAFPIPAEFPPGAKFLLGGGDPVVDIPGEGLFGVNADGMLVAFPAKEFARAAPPSELGEAAWRESVAEEVAFMRERERDRLAARAAP
jgi:hypothetical protein